MTETTAVPEEYLAQVREVADASRSRLCTPSILRTAASALYDVEEQLYEHGIYEQFVRPLGSLAARIMRAVETRVMNECYYVTTDVDPVSLLHTAIAAASDRLGRPLEPTDGPALGDGRELVAYVVLPRELETPAIENDDQAPVVVTLGRPDQEALRLVYSSGGGPMGPYEPGPWAWHLTHKVPNGLYIGSGTQITAPEPSDASAAEVGELIADFLTGEITLPG
ncbi:hypothetical protein J4573_40570 [Actinomadura barringtoniae]|uniref:Uncharacterized protein n=1 Tax=Actinomadura barringtoniae TaxID=1427535 RepID=A0A939T8R5_9ACTN|nr:hypothetical protein [Actinomadura barringtoniae]MBO2453444.1 hypothetical protein [Actinomadura barringtoniae]